MIQRRKTPRPKALWFQIQQAKNGASEKLEAVGKFYGRKETFGGNIQRRQKKPFWRNSKKTDHLQKKPGFTHRLRPVSTRQKFNLRLYAFIREFLLAKKPMCCVISNLNATEIHHLRGRRGTLLIDWRFFALISRQPHDQIKEHPTAARAAGLLCEAGQWENPPQDERTAQLRGILHMQDFRRAKLELIHLMRSCGMDVELPRGHR